MTTITRTRDSAVSTPTLVLGYESSYEGRNVVHPLLDGEIAVTLVPQLPRAGTLELLYELEADAWAAVALHLGTDTFQLDDDDVASVNMLYVAGTVTPALEDTTRSLWLVSVQYQEIRP